MSKTQNDITDFINDLDSVFRFSRNYLIRPETVLQHSGSVAFLCLYLAHLVNYTEETISIDRLLQSALVHDMDEIITGDIIHSTKYANDTLLQELKNLATEKVDVLVKDYHLSNKWIPIWKKQNLTPQEKAILKTADVISAAIICCREVYTFSNMSMLGVLKDVITNIDQCIKMCGSYPTLYPIVSFLQSVKQKCLGVKND
jgi:5'-deoxynucleotidase YfbR-like HD superfamily hydrolase